MDLETNGQSTIRKPLEDEWGEDFREIISRPPNFLVRCGSTLIFGVLAIILFLSTVIRFPDVVDGELEIVGSLPASPVVAKISGSLELQVEEEAFTTW